MVRRRFGADDGELWEWRQPKGIWICRVGHLSRLFDMNAAVMGKQIFYYCNYVGGGGGRRIHVQAARLQALTRTRVLHRSISARVVLNDVLAATGSRCGQHLRGAAQSLGIENTPDIFHHA